LYQIRYEINGNMYNDLLADAIEDWTGWYAYDNWVDSCYE